MVHEPCFASIYVVSCGVTPKSGDPATPVYLAALKLGSSAAFQAKMPKLQQLRAPAYPTEAQALLITVQAEDLACVHLALGWRTPERVIDLLVEFRNIVNGRVVPGGPGLVGALIWFGLHAAAGFGAGHTAVNIKRRLGVIVDLFQRMRPHLDWGRAMLRGRYLMAAGRIEMTGVPVDTEQLERLTANWLEIRARVIAEIDKGFGVYREGVFQINAFDEWLALRGIEWPRNVHGKPVFNEDIFKERSRSHPELRPLKDLQATLTGFTPKNLTIGGDGRNRIPLRPFASRTGRNQPSAKASVFGGPAWARYLVRPEPGMGIALIDWDQQEFGVAAALSGDVAMQAAYRAGDPYMAFAIAAGATSNGATRQTQPNVRDQYKACALGVQYGMGAKALARMLNITLSRAQGLIERHKAIYPTFWRWSENIEAEGLMKGRLHSVFGWHVTVGRDPNPRFLRNFPMQANGAEMLRLACCLVTETGIRVCAPLHDALLIEAELMDLEDAVAETQRLMAESSAIVLDGFTLRSEVRLARYPERLGDKRGHQIWKMIEQSIGEEQA